MMDIERIFYLPPSNFYISDNLESSMLKVQKDEALIIQPLTLVTSSQRFLCEKNWKKMKEEK